MSTNNYPPKRIGDTYGKAVNRGYRGSYLDEAIMGDWGDEYDQRRRLNEEAEEGAAHRRRLRSRLAWW
jgi:hypothetical protein